MSKKAKYPKSTNVQKLVVHVAMKYRDPIYGPIYEGWVEGVNTEAAYIIGGLAGTHCSMSVNQADIYVGKCMLKAAEFAQGRCLAPDGSLYHPNVQVEVNYH